MHEFWFLTRLYKARLISFYLEENPSVLNAASDHYHSFYDKDGSRKYLTDDEGNRLKSVASSPELLGLCSSNDIESIYISLPVIEMFQMRGRIALITAIISFVLIFILLGTVTLTNKEEEELYAEVSEADSTDRLDHVIFNVILPSGRSVPTVTAAARWDNRRIPWKHKSPEQKLLFIVSVICGILLFTVFMSYLPVQRLLLSEHGRSGTGLFPQKARVCLFEDRQPDGSGF